MRREDVREGMAVTNDALANLNAVRRTRTVLRAADEGVWLAPARGTTPAFVEWPLFERLWRPAKGGAR